MVAYPKQSPAARVHILTLLEHWRSVICIREKISYFSQLGLKSIHIRLCKIV